MYPFLKLSYLSNIFICKGPHILFQVRGHRALKCFKEPSGPPNLLQMKHLTIIPLKHRDAGHQGTEGREQLSSSVLYIAGPAAVQPLNELRWTQSIRSQVCGSGKKADHRGKAPLSRRELFPSSALLL